MMINQQPKGDANFVCFRVYSFVHGLILIGLSIGAIVIHFQKSTPFFFIYGPLWAGIFHIICGLAAFSACNFNLFYYFIFFYQLI